MQNNTNQCANPHKRYSATGVKHLMQSRSNNCECSLFGMRRILLCSHVLFLYRTFFSRLHCTSVARPASSRCVCRLRSSSCSSAIHAASRDSHSASTPSSPDLQAYLSTRSCEQCCRSCSRPWGVTRCVARKMQAGTDSKQRHAEVVTAAINRW